MLTSHKLQEPALASEGPFCRHTGEDDLNMSGKPRRVPLTELPPNSLLPGEEGFPQVGRQPLGSELRCMVVKDRLKVFKSDLHILLRRASRETQRKAGWPC